MVKMIDLESTNLQAAGYDPAEHTLYITFRDGGKTYRYLRCPPLIFDELLKAKSKGRFFSEQIRDLFPFEIVAVAMETTA